MASPFSKGKYALSISDREGQAYPYLEMVKEWTGALVDISEYEPKSPQLDPKVYGGDPQAIRNARVQHNLGQMTVHVGQFTGTLGSPTFLSEHGYDITTGDFMYGMLPAKPGKRLDILSAVGKVTVVT